MLLQTTMQWTGMICFPPDPWLLRKAWWWGLILTLTRVENCREPVRSRPRHNWAIAPLFLADYRYALSALMTNELHRKLSWVSEDKGEKRVSKALLTWESIEEKTLIWGASSQCSTSHLSSVVLWHLSGLSPWCFRGWPHLTPPPPTLADFYSFN